jgi:hypothetical protein
MQQGQPGRVASLLPGFNWSKGTRRRVLGTTAAHSMPSSGRKGTARGININAKRAQQHYAVPMEHTAAVSAAAARVCMSHAQSSFRGAP